MNLDINNPGDFYNAVTNLVDHHGANFAAADAFLTAAVGAGVAPDLDAAWSLAVLDREGAPESEIDTAMAWHWSRWSAADWQAQQDRRDGYRGQHRR